jgi:hypothetical protein
MNPRETRQRFRAQLKDLHLDPDHLDPWSGWRAFKEFLKQEVPDAYDAAAVQVRPLDDGTSMFFVRQFTHREDASSEAADVLVGRLIVEFHYDSRHLPEEELWTLDYPTLEEWAAVVEGERSFQALVNQEPIFSDVYYDAGPD